MAATKAPQATGDANLETRKRQLLAIAPTPVDIASVTAKVRAAKPAPKVEAKADKPKRQENPPRPLGTTPETYACRAAGCKEPNLAPTHADGLCAKHREMYHDNTWRLTAAGMRKLEVMRAEGTALPHAKAAKPRAAKAADKKSNVVSIRKPAPAPERVARSRVPAQMAALLAPGAAKVAKVPTGSAK
jgi:hypothetical protein